MSDRVIVGKSSWYVTGYLVNSAFHPSGIGKASTSGWR